MGLRVKGKIALLSPAPGFLAAHPQHQASKRHEHGVRADGDRIKANSFAKAQADDRERYEAGDANEEFRKAELFHGRDCSSD